MAKGGGGKGSGGKNAPSGGASPKRGGGNAPSGGGGSPKSSPTSAIPAPGPKPPAAPTGGGGSAQSAPAKAVNAAKAFQSTSRSSSPSQQKEKKQEQKEKKQERVKALTTKAKTLITGATSEGIADPGKFKDILGKLKDLGKDKRVQNLQTQKKTAVSTAKAAAQAPGGNKFSQEDLDKAVQDALSKAGNSGITQEDLDAALANVGKTGLTQEDLDEALSRYSPQTNPLDTGAAAAGTSEFDDWIKSFESQQDAGAFDPDLFRGLLGELESSKRRQKDWNERSAKASYKY